MGKRLNRQMGKFERLFCQIAFLQKRNSATVPELALHCQASTRTIFRDLKLLSKTGIVTQAKSGWALVSKSVFLPLELSPQEYLTLYWALQSSIIKEAEFLGASGNKIISKIRSHLSRGVENSVGNLKETLHIDLKQTGLAEKELFYFAGLQKALSQNVVVRIEYDSLDSGVSVRRVDPYALTFRKHAWYLAGWDHKSDQYRIFRLSRIKKLTLISERFERDAGFSLEKIFQQSWEVFTGEPVTVKARLTRKAAKIVASGKRHPSEKLLLQKDGSVVYTATVAGLEEISHWLLSFGSEAEVLEPVELRSKFNRIARDLYQIYAKRYSLAAGPRPLYRVRSLKKK